MHGWPRGGRQGAVEPYRYGEPAQVVAGEGCQVADQVGEAADGLLAGSGLAGAFGVRGFNDDVHSHGNACLSTSRQDLAGELAVTSV